MTHKQLLDSLFDVASNPLVEELLISFHESLAKPRHCFQGSKEAHMVCVRNYWNHTEEASYMILYSCVFHILLVTQ